MSGRKIKLLILTGWAIFAVALFSFQFFAPARTQAQKNAPAPTPTLKTKPDAEAIDRFDRLIQKRFLTEPFFGMARIAPTTPQPLRSAHIRVFHPKNQEEVAGVAEFENEGFNVSLHLFGRRATQRIKKGVPQQKFDIKYRLNRPVSITERLEEKEITEPKKLLKEVKKAFIEFQTPGSAFENEYSFELGKWSYVARPVRAVNQSCLQCHKDHVVTAKLGNGTFKFRPRRLGDANGVLVYGFSKKD